MQISEFIAGIENIGVNSYVGVPDSQLKSLCDYLIKHYGISKKHIIAANEGNAVAIAAGNHLSTGQISCVYLQNSGLGNIINPVTSLLNQKVYAIPCIFVIGWRGEPDVHDEPQHVFQGQTTLKTLDAIDIKYMIIDKKTSVEDFKNCLSEFEDNLKEGNSVAFVVKKGGLSNPEQQEYMNSYNTLREDIIKELTKVANTDIIVSTTGKSSRELFEIRVNNLQSHKYDFLTVGSMGHSSSIALGISLNKPSTRVWCIDGDGAALMHLGAMALVGANSPSNFIHILINNMAHESVGGQPTATGNVNFSQIASACGYKISKYAKDINEFREILQTVKNETGPIFIEVKSAIGSRDDLGRPTTTPVENKKAFMEYLKECK